VVGVDLNRVSPTWAITLILIVVLGSVAVRTLRHAAEMRREELASHFEREQREAQGGSGGEVSLDTELGGGFGGTDGSRSSLGAASPGLGGAHMHGGSGEAGDEKEEEAGGDAGEEEGGRVRRGLVEALDEAAEADCSDGEDAPLLARTADASERGRRCVVKGKGRGNAAQDWVRWGSEGSVGVLDGSRRVAADWATEMRGEERGTPGRQVLRMLACSLLVSALAVAKGGENGSGLVVCGSPGYWALKVAAMLLLLLAGRLTSLDLLRRHAAKEQVSSPPTRCHTRSCVQCSVTCVTLVAGGLRVPPLRGAVDGQHRAALARAVHRRGRRRRHARHRRRHPQGAHHDRDGRPAPGRLPIRPRAPARPHRQARARGQQRDWAGGQVVAATAAYMLLFTTASTTAQFAALRVVLWDYAASLGSPARPFRVTPRMRAPARKPERANKTPARRLLTREGWGFAEDRVTAALAAVASQLVMKKFIESHHFQARPASVAVHAPPRAPAQVASARE